MTSLGAIQWPCKVEAVVDSIGCRGCRQVVAGNFVVENCSPVGVPFLEEEGRNLVEGGEHSPGEEGHNPVGVERHNPVVVEEHNLVAWANSLVVGVVGCSPVFVDNMPEPVVVVGLFE